MKKNTWAHNAYTALSKVRWHVVQNEQWQADPKEIGPRATLNRKEEGGGEEAQEERKGEETSGEKERASVKLNKASERETTFKGMWV